MCVALICSSVSLTFCFSSVVSEPALCCSATSPLGCAAPDPGTNPTVLRTDCDSPGNRLALATPSANTTIRIDRRRTMLTCSKRAKTRSLIRAQFTLRRLEVFGNRLELAHDGARRLASAIGRRIEAMIDVVMNQRFFSFAEGFFDGVQLLGNIDTWTSLLDHRNDPPEVPLRPLQALHDIPMRLVYHLEDPIPLHRMRQGGLQFAWRLLPPRVRVCLLTSDPNRFIQVPDTNSARSVRVLMF